MGCSMERMSALFPKLMENFRDIFDPVTMSVFVLSGLIILLFDTREMKQKGLDREARMTQFLGWFYIISGIALFTAAQILNFFGFFV